MNHRVRSFVFSALMVLAACPLHLDVKESRRGEPSPRSARAEPPAPVEHQDVALASSPPAPDAEPVQPVLAAFRAPRERARAAPGENLAAPEAVRAPPPRERVSFAAAGGTPTLAMSVPAFGGSAGRLSYIAPHPSFSPRALLRCGATLAGAVPNPVNASLDCRMEALGFSLGSGMFSQKFKISSLDAKANLKVGNVEARVRWYPFRGVFFLGSGLGYQAVHLNVQKDIQVDVGLWTETVTATVDLRTLRFYATPHLGWEFTFAGHARIGWEVGALVPIVPRTSVDISLDSHGGLTVLALGLADIFGVDDAAEKQIRQAGRYPLPYVALRAGWMF